MTPYFDADGITLYCGDSRDILPTLHGDALVTDPPFGVRFDRATWDDDPAAYPALMAWLVATARVVVPNGWCFVFQGQPHVGRFHEWFPEGWRIFAACKNFAQIRKTSVWHAWDPVVFWRHGTPPPLAPRIPGFINRDFHVGNVVGSLGVFPGHPCPRPLDTMTHLVQIAAPPAGIVVDPFAGSGTTLVAAQRTGRRAIGIEIDERYCAVAVERLAQRPLFGVGR